MVGGFIFKSIFPVYRSVPRFFSFDNFWPGGVNPKRTDNQIHLFLLKLICRNVPSFREKVQ